MFGHLAGRSVFNTPTGFTHFRPIFGLLFENVIFGLLFENVQGRSGRTRFGNRARRLVGLACCPTMRTPSTTTELLASMPASEAAAERVFSAQPVVQETESASTDLKDEAYGGLLLKATPPKKSARSPGLLDDAKAGHTQQWLKDEDSESEEESPVLSANTKAWITDSFVEGQPRSFTSRSHEIAKTFVDLTGEPASKRASGSALFASPPPTERRLGVP